MEEWQAEKASHNKLISNTRIFCRIYSFVYLFGDLSLAEGHFKDQAIHFHPVEKLYNDVNLALCFLLIPLWIVLVDDVFGNMA